MLFTGHDELIYHALRASDHRCPSGPCVLRFHSFYPWHTHGAYSAYADEVDHAYLPHLLEFNRCDLYKCATPVSEGRELDEIVARFIGRHPVPDRHRDRVHSSFRTEGEKAHRSEEDAQTFETLRCVYIFFWVVVDRLESLGTSFN